MLRADFHEIWVQVGYAPKKNDAERFLDIISLQVSRKCRHPATAWLPIELGHFERLRLYWYNGQY